MREKMLSQMQIVKIQKKIHYIFKNPVLLSQAFTRKSYSAVYGGKDNEVLEFFGDRVLDFVVSKDFFEQYGKIDIKDEFTSSKSVGELSKIDINLVKNKNLAKQIGVLSLSKFMKVQTPIERCIEKNKADLFEAILGAVAVDSGWNVADICSVYHAMMYTKGSSTDEKEAVIKSKNTIELFENIVISKKLFKTENIYSEKQEYTFCSFAFELNGVMCKINERGKDRHEAKSNAYEAALNLFQLVEKKTFLRGEDFTNQAYFLEKYGFITGLEVHYEFYPATSHKDEVWRCFLTAQDCDTEFVAENIEMQEAREDAMYAFLCNVMCIKELKLGSFAEVRGQGLLKLILSRLERYNNGEEL